MLVFFIINEVLDPSADNEMFGDLSSFPESSTIVLSRFVCGVVLHMSLQGEFYQGLTCMKYAVNHPRTFQNYQVAFFGGLLQASMVILVELVNFVVIQASSSILDVVMNFLALAVIADFDDFFYSSLIHEKYKKVIDGDVEDFF